MEVCCEAHLIVKINEYLALAQKSEVTEGICFPASGATCDYCKAIPKYWVAYLPK